MQPALLEAICSHRDDVCAVGDRVVDWIYTRGMANESDLIAGVVLEVGFLLLQLWGIAPSAVVCSVFALLWQSHWRF